MNTPKLLPILLALPLAVISLACPTRVGPPEDGTGGSPSGGHGGSSATDAGAGGTTGVAGAGGSTVVTGTGGTGVAGAGGTAGVTGTGGAAGVTGTGGAAGVTGTGGAAGVTGTGGSAGVTGTGGSGETCSPACNSSTQTCVGTKCMFNDGQSCSVASQCASNACTPFYVDVDGDGYGYGQAVSFCGTSPPTGYATQGGDCCDDAVNLAVARLIHPNAQYQATSAGGVCGVTWDYDCDGIVEVQQFQHISDCGTPPSCEATIVSTALMTVNCGGTVSFEEAPGMCRVDMNTASETYGQCYSFGNTVTKPVGCK